MLVPTDIPMHILDWRLDQWAEFVSYFLPSLAVVKKFFTTAMAWAAKMFCEVMTHQARGI